jgi:hypothetical protein
MKKVKGRMTDSQRDIVDRLCAQRDEIAQQLDIEGSLLGSRSTLEQVVSDLGAEGAALMDWQLQLLQPAIQSIEVSPPSEA